MASSLIRGRYVISKVTGRASAVMVPDGAVAQRDGMIVEVGGYDDLRARYPTEPVLGSHQHVVLPGLVNDHFHVGLSPFQLGAPNLPLELWSFARLGAKEVDPYLFHEPAITAWSGGVKGYRPRPTWEIYVDTVRLEATGEEDSRPVGPSCERAR